MKRFLIKINGVNYEVEALEISKAAIETPDIFKENTELIGTQATPFSLPPEKKDAGASVDAEERRITAPMPGTILGLKVKAGEKFMRGQVLYTLETMKMENEIKSQVEGTVTSLSTVEGASVNTGDLVMLVAVKPDS